VAVAPADTGLFGYLRHLPDRSRPLLVVLNFARDSFDVTVDLPAGFPSVSGAARFRDLLGGESITVGGASPLELRMGALGAYVLEPEEAA
jgi:hypothetical protein